MHMPPATRDFVPPPAGTHLAVCYRLIDLGTQLITFQGKGKKQHKIMLSWELPEELMDNGKPFSIHRRYTWSSSKKATLRKDLESWRGVKFSDEDIDKFDIRNILGKGCMLSLVHDERDGTTYANIAAVSKLPKGTTAPEPLNPTVYFNLQQFSIEVFDTLPERLRDVIKMSPEYAVAMGLAQPETEPVDGRVADLDDEIPF